jgi:hypothetical protein
MAQVFAMEIPKWILVTLNNLYEVEKKLALHGDTGNAMRNVEKMKDVFVDMGVFYEDPMGQEFKETRTDLDVSISGSGTENLVVVEVIKPIVRAGEAAFSKVVQKGIVVVESKEGNRE